MANVNDYLVWRGDLSLNKIFSFNEIDGVILSRFSYLIFDKIKMNNKETIYSIYNKMKDFDTNDFLHDTDKELICLLGQSNRFKNMIVTDYVKNNNSDLEKQFSAITIHINDKELFVSYIGTDSTINGWKEDFNMSFMSDLPCQVSGREYLEVISNKYPNKKIRIGGHSKGGNVAIYSFVTTNKDIQKKVIKVYNFDGPGFHKDFIDKYGNNSVIEKIETFIPQGSIIGRMLGHKEKVTICLSNDKGLYQHFTSSWEILKDSFVKVDKTTKTSQNINNMLIKWLDSTSIEERKIFVDSLFELCEKEDDLDNINPKKLSNLSKILSKYKKISPEEKKHITNMIKLFIVSYYKSIRDNKNNKVNN